MNECDLVSFRPAKRSAAYGSAPEAISIPAETGRMNGLENNSEKAEVIAEMLKAIAHPVRLRILAILSRGDQNVMSLVKTLGVPQPLVSQHLRNLRVRGVLISKRDGHTVRYSLAYPRLRELLEYLAGCPE
jgi:ArsR family transcriptional regulator